MKRLIASFDFIAILVYSLLMAFWLIAEFSLLAPTTH